MRQILSRYDTDDFVVALDDDEVAKTHGAKDLKYTE